MKVNYLRIDGYKNLKNKAIFDDLSSSMNYIALIGLNGSGKSNVLEAIGHLFASLYNNTSPGFSYKINYEVNGYDVTVIDGKVTSNGQEIKKTDLRDYLPAQIIACYSGEEQRLWEMNFEPFYFDFFRKVLGRYPNSKPDLLYVNKYCWNIALIALMCSEKPSVKGFLKDVLNITVDENILIDFEFDTRNYPGYKRHNEVLSLISRINPDQVAKPAPLSIKTLSSFEIGATDNDDFVRKIFFSLYIASMPQKNKVIRADKIISSININFNGINVKGLSEGEKKLLLIKFIMDVLSTEASLVLFDEPDAHIHISRKKEIKDFIDKDNFFTIMTSHSPSLLHSLDENNIRIIKNGEHGLEVIPSKKVISIEEISGGAFTLMNATLAFTTNKDMLLVEGAIDYKYISKAMEILQKTKGNKYDLLDFAIINCGGAGNIAAVLEEAIIPYISDRQLCIATFDCDKAGNDGIESIDKILAANPKTNIKRMTHPKIDAWTSSEFVLEDYFPVDAYKTKYEGEVAKATTFKSLTSIQKPKGMIEKHYLSFQDTDYNNFEKLLDELLRLKKEFQGQP